MPIFPDGGQSRDTLAIPANLGSAYCLSSAKKYSKWPILAPAAAMENLCVFGTTTQDFNCQINQETIIYTHNTFRKNFYNLYWVG
jgi:hypothetical protein